jgi:hypothetical protein
VWALLLNHPEMLAAAFLQSCLMVPWAVALKQTSRTPSTSRGTEIVGENRPLIAAGRRMRHHRRIHLRRREFPDSEYSALLSRGDFRSQMLRLNHEIYSL